MPPTDLPVSDPTALDDPSEDGITIDLAAEERSSPVDGRHARSERSRQAMVDAVLDLLKEGNPRPSSAQIAERAGVTQRTLFNQFGDMETLISAVASRQTQRILKLLPRAGDGPFDERVVAYCDGLELMLEEAMHVRWAVVTSPTPIPRTAAVIRTVREFMRQHVADAFEPELSQLSDAEHDTIIDALEIEIDPVVWRTRRVQQGLSVADARRVVQRSLTALLRDAVASA